MLGNLIGGFVVILVGVNLMPVIADQVYAARNDNGSFGTNITSSASAILGLTTIFFALGVMAAGISLAVTGLKNAGLV